MKLQFRLRTLMIVVTLLAVPLGYVGWQAKIVRERNAMRARLETNHNLVIPPHWDLNDAAVGNMRLVVPRANENAEVSWLRKRLGDRPVCAIILYEASEEEFRATCAVFSEAQVARQLNYGSFETGPEPSQD